MNPWNELQKAHNEWENRNFPGQPIEYSAMGLMEEFGELTHARLKSLQSIRGSAEEHDEKGKDALADMMIYMLGFLGKSGLTFDDITDPHTGRCAVGDDFVAPSTERMCWSMLSLCVGQLCFYQDTAPKHQFGQVISLMADYADMKGWGSLYYITEATWKSIVSKRDWQADPEKGGE